MVVVGRCVWGGDGRTSTSVLVGVKVQEETDIGQSCFGHPDLANFGQSNFGNRCGSGVCVCHGGAKGWGLNPEKVGAPKCEGPEIRSFCLSLGVLSWNFGCVSSAGTL